MDSRSFGNPFFSQDTFNNAEPSNSTMTRGGVAMWLLGLLLIFGATFGFQMYHALEAFKGINFELIERVDTGRVDSKNKPISEMKYYDPQTQTYGPLPSVDLQRVMKLMWIGCIGGFFVCMICIFAKQLSPLLGPVYAALQGLALGGISAAYELQFGGIVIQAAVGTITVLVVMYGLFATGIIRVSGPAVTITLGLMLGLLGLYIADLVLPMLGGEHFSFIHSNSWQSIAFSGAVCLLAAWCLAIDFQTIEEGIDSRAPKYMEAYCAFSVLVTLVWLYLEILRLIAKARSRKSD
jgi:uncharacterized YccA/Bax inhibitor family protein